MTIAVEINFCKENISDFSDLSKAAFGSMESNIFTLVGNRIKGRRACWSIRGATNLANLLCLYHTTGFAGMFTGFVMPATETPSYNCKPLSASKAPLKAGKAYQCRSRATVPNLPWLMAITGYKPLAEIRLNWREQNTMAQNRVLD